MGSAGQYPDDDLWSVIVAENPSDLLNSWKEVAAYLDHGIRTVQRWEQSNRLPVHRYGNSKRAPVFALKSEMRNWLHDQERVRPQRNLAPFPRPSTDTVDREILRTSELVTQLRVNVARSWELRQQSQVLRLQKRR